MTKTWSNCDEWYTSDGFLFQDDPEMRAIVDEADDARSEYESEPIQVSVADLQVFLSLICKIRTLFK